MVPSERGEAPPKAERPAAVIRRLPTQVQNQIAAGEVVERPASVVKELLENCLDAGATHIRLELEEGGMRLIRVIDDGVGMGAEDLPLAFAPHATSKLYELADLDHIASLGFRGEALASIGSVARCEIVSRQRGSETGHRVQNLGGQRSEVFEAGAPLGTQIEVRDLFFNTPARRRFLKSTPAELSRCLDVVQRIALAQVGVGFTVTHDGRRVYEVQSAMDLRERVRRTFGAELAEALQPVEASAGPELGALRLVGLLAPPRFSRRDLSRQMWFLNGRIVRDKLLVRALKEGYRGFLEEGRQPAAFLGLELEPGLVDVNVHPTKAEVRFRQERALVGFLIHHLRRTVAGLDLSTPGETLLASAARRGAWTPAPDTGGTAWPPAGNRQQWLRDPGPEAPEGAGRSTPQERASGGASGGAIESPGEEQVYELPRTSPRDQSAQDPAEPGPWEATDRLEGPFLQIANTYLLRAVPGGFEVIDQHALHERITFEGLLEELQRGAVECQRLLIPEPVELARDEVRLLEPHLEALGKLGLDFSLLGETTILVQGLPRRLGRAQPAPVVQDVVALLETHGRLPNPAELLEEVLHRSACRASVMAGDALSQDQIRALLEAGRRLESDQTCPHSRPTRVRFTLADLEKAFHRR